MIVTEGATNVSVPFYFVDDVGGTAPGEPTTALLFSDIETGGSASYQRQGAARVDFSLITLASASAAHADGGFILVDDTEMPGVYRCDIPDAAVAAGVDFVIIYLRAAAANNTITRPIKIELTSVDLRDSVRGGMTALPNAAADGVGGLPVSDAGAINMDALAADAARLTEARAAVLTDWIDGGRLDVLLDAIPTTAMRGTDGANTTVPDAAGTAASALVAIHLDHLFAVDYDPASQPGVATALLNELIESDGGVSRYTVNALENGPSGTGASAAAIADAVWDEAQADHVAAGSFGVIASEVAAIPTTAMRGTDSANTTVPDAAGTAATLIGAAGAALTDLGGMSTGMKAEVNAEVDTALADYDGPTKAEMDTGHGLLATEAKQDIIDTNVDEVKLDTEDIQSRVPAALVTGRMSSDAVAISGSTDAADKVEAAAETIEVGAATATTLTTTTMSTNLTEATDDHYNGRVIIWTSGVLLRQATDITDYTGATKLLTFTAVTEAPSDTDTFVIV